MGTHAEVLYITQLLQEIDSELTEQHKAVQRLPRTGLFSAFRNSFAEKIRTSIHSRMYGILTDAGVRMRFSQWDTQAVTTSVEARERYFLIDLLDTFICQMMDVNYAFPDFRTMCAALIDGSQQHK